MKYVYTIFLFIIAINLINVNAESKTDCVIVTNLDEFMFMSPALTENNSFVYNNFEFRLYTDSENTSYYIESDNILIANGSIREFRKIIYWKCDRDIISFLSVQVGNIYFNYSNIWVFTSSITNGSPRQEEDLIGMTQREFDLYINELRVRLFTADSIGWFVGLILAQIYVRQYKSTRIEDMMKE